MIDANLAKKWADENNIPLSKIDAEIQFIQYDKDGMRTDSKPLDLELNLNTPVAVIKLSTLLPYNVTFLPPITIMEQFNLINGGTVPIKFTARNSSTNEFVYDETVNVSITNSTGSLIADFVYGTGANNVNINSADEQYVVNFNSMNYALKIGESYSITVTFGGQDALKGYAIAHFFVVEGIPPTTTAMLSGTLGNNGWYRSDVIVNLTASDNGGGSAVNKIEYSFDNAAWMEYNTEFSISTEGTTTLYYRSTDNAENVEPAKNIAISIDKTSPVIESITLYPANTTAGATINVFVQASDNVGVIEVKADSISLIYSNGEWNHGSITAPSTIGDYMVLIKAKDAAGNEVVSSAPYRVVLRQGGASVSVSPMSNNVIGGTSIVLNIKVKNTQNIDDTFNVHINVSDLPLSSRADLAWFNWTQKVIDIKAGSEAIVPIMITVPAGVSGTKAFRAKENSAVLPTYVYGTGYLKIT